MTQKHLFQIFPLILLTLFVTACNQQNSKSAGNLSQVDTIDCWVDSSLLVLSREEVKSFDNVFKFPRLRLSACNEIEIIKGLMDNKVNLAILHRTLDSNEVEYIFKKEQFRPKQYEFAYDAYVFLTAVSSGIDSINYQSIADNLRTDGNPSLTICVENSKAQSLKFLKSHFRLTDQNLKNIKSPGSLNAMMDYLRKNPGTFGVIPFSLIADIEAQKTVEFLKDLRVLKITLKDKQQKGIVFTVEPSQSSIATKIYPLISPVVLVNCNMDKKSGINFVNYIFKTKSQRLIQQFGLCPAIFPGREVLIQQ